MWCSPACRAEASAGRRGGGRRGPHRPPPPPPGGRAGGVDVVLSRVRGGGVRVLRSEDAREHMLAPRPAKGGAALGLGVGSLETALILFDDTQGS